MKKIRKIVILAYLSSFLFNTAISQTKIPIPTYKGDEFKEHEKHYSYWVKRINSINEQLRVDQTLTRDEKNTLLYNRFITYYQAIPDDSTDILHIFFDAFDFDKYEFCEAYIIVIRDDDTVFDWAKPSYGMVGFNMNLICDCVVQSYNKNLIEKLEEMRERDQKFRSVDVNMEKQYILDSLNRKEIDSIISNYGYPNRRIVGRKYENYLASILLHTSLEFMEKYYPAVEKSVDEGLLRESSIANLYDRIEMLNNRPQKFGTQYIENENGDLVLYKLIDKKNVNKFREEIGLPKLEFEKL